MASHSATITSWSDGEVKVTLDEPFVGIMRTVLTNPGGKHDTYSVFMSKGETVYEQDLPLDTSTGNPYAYEAQSSRDAGAAGSASQGIGFNRGPRQLLAGSLAFATLHQLRA